MIPPLNQCAKRASPDCDEEAQRYAARLEDLGSHSICSGGVGRDRNSDLIVMLLLLPTITS
jgi:hypothetical protein